ncbi:CopD family protein [Gordonia sp. CPCC 205515]|uniref:copper resistance D family protein n=1 Tax=Gordonia sp. CPCC 205515 TaxID=3140791 RepID=UPI003AF3ED5C
MGIASNRTHDTGSRHLRGSAVGAGLLAILIGVGLCWVLATPAGPEAVAIPAGVALGAAVLLVGLGALPQIGPEPSTAIIGVAGGLWLGASLVAAWIRTAERAGEAPRSVTVNQFIDSVSSGAAEPISVIAALLVVVFAFVALTGRATPPVLTVAILAAIGILATSIAGHPGQRTWGPLLVGTHALAAAWWCGTLAAMIVTVRGRRGWASVLPAFSARAVWAVAVIAVTGVIAGLVEVGGPGALVSTGYGRVLLAKLIGLAALIALGARHRRRWVPRASRHQVTDEQSIRIAATELALMAVVLGLAVGLSTTAP